jgi:hypothetical protein
MTTLIILSLITLILSISIFYLIEKIYLFFDLKKNFTYKSVTKNTCSPYVINIKNENEKPSKSVIFGYNKFFLSDNFGSEKGIKITNAHGSDYQHLLSQSAHKPFKCKLIRIQSSNSLDLKITFKSISSDANGLKIKEPIHAMNYFSPYQFQSGIIDITKPINVDGNYYLKFKSPAKSSITLAFFPEDRIIVNEFKFETKLLDLIKSDIQKTKYFFSLKYNNIKNYVCKLFSKNK